MNDYLSTLAIRALRPDETLQPRRSGMFEPSAAPFGQDAISRFSGGWEPESAMAAGGPVEEPSAASWLPERSVEPLAPSVHEGDEPDNALPAEAVRSGEMAAEEVPGRVRIQNSEPLFRSHDIPVARNDAGSTGRDTGIVPPAHGTGAAAERSGRFLKLPVPHDASMVPPSEPELSLIPSPERMQPGIAPAGRGSSAEREARAFHPEGHEPGAAVLPVADGVSGRIAGSLREGDMFSSEEPAWISSPAPELPERRLMPPSAPAGADPYQTRNEPPVVRVTIGRVEVRAIMPQAPSRPDPPARKRAPGLSLDEYLRSQKRGGR